MKTIALGLLLGFCGVAHAQPAKLKDGNDASKKPKPKFTISKETTFVTGPLDKNGLIDYAAALNERLGKGVTAENNANVPIWQAIGPMTSEKKMPARFFQLMGMAELSERGEYFITLSHYLKDFPTFDRFNRFEVEQELEPAFLRSWALKDFPIVAAWLKANEKPLALVVAASKRPQFFSPSVPDPSFKGQSTLVSSLLPNVVYGRDLTNALICRAMLRIGERHFDDAWEDLIAAHRLARLFGRAGTMMDNLVGIAAELRVSRAELVFLERAKSEPQQFQQCLKDLQSLPPLMSIVGIVDVGERCFFLDAVMTSMRLGISHIETHLLFSEGDFAQFMKRSNDKAKPDPRTLTLLDDVDWDPILREGNDWYNRVVATMRESDRVKRDAQLQAFEEASKKAKQDLPKAADLVKTFQNIKSDPAAKGKLLRAIYACPFESARQMQHAAERAVQIERDQHIAFALAAYQREQGSYPKSLDALAPKYLAKIPNDLFTGKALIYRPNEKGYLLYSLGSNLKDDEGRGFDDDPPGDDPSVRMPVPPLRRKDVK